MAQNAIFCAINRFDSGTYTASASSPQLPVSNLANRQLSKVWRTLSVVPADTWLTCDFGAVRQIDVIALLAHNITSVGQWRIRLSNDSTFSTSIYDSGLQKAWPSMSSFGVKPWGVFTWGEALGSFEIPADLKPNSILVLDDSVNAQYLRIDISDATNADGYIQAGRCYAGPKYQPTKNISYGWENGYIDESEVSKSIGGQTYIDEKSRYRVVSINLEFLAEEEAYLNLFEFIDRRKGISGDLLFIPKPDRPDLFLHEVIYGRMRDLGPQINPYYNVVSKAYVIEELL